MGFLGSGFLPEIINAYGGLRTSMRKQLDKNPGEEGLLALLVFGCFVVFLSFLPRLLATDLSQSPDQSIAGGIILWFFVVMFFLPLLMYGIAWISHFFSMAFGATSSNKTARHALFWALAVLSPALIAKAMLSSVFIQIGGVLGHNTLNALNIILALAILRIWGAMLAEAKEFRSEWRVSGVIFSVLAGISLIIRLGA
ncbi:hypothetical protein A9Q96_02155 [Rhodobacterales bacterium 52_120_T64]|nr:hypothetical protein A9Q96_02155 [Rhodobacterales bacterium 52_120_T64]